MKRTVTSSVAVVLLAGIRLWGADPSTPAAPPAKACTLATFRGTYLLIARLDSPAYAPLTGVPQVVGGLRNFDGAGNISGVATVNAGGVITQNVRAPGVYTINPDCTGTMTNSGTRHYDIFVAADGSEAVAIRTDPGAVEILTFKRASGPHED
jgi:hypothetical protein